jgi:glycosyltransferase involved in cell wall biosynthesis
MKKLRIAHVINNMGLGGAELLLKNTINLLPYHHHLIIYLSKPDFVIKDISVEIEHVCIGHNSWWHSYKTVKKIKEMLLEWKPDIVHAHLFTASLLTRFAISRHQPLLSTLHSTYSVDAFPNKKALWLEQMTANRQDALVAVSKFVLDDYLQNVAFRQKTFVLYNFIPDSPLQKQNWECGNPVKCVAVGSLKEAKNYTYLIEVFTHLKEHNIALDIFGEGPLKDALQHAIDDSGANITLRGKADNILEELIEYDFFIQASTHEGYGISVAEAMHVKLPLFIADIPVFHEVTNEFASFFPLNDSITASKKMIQFIHEPDLRKELSEHAYQFIKQFSPKSYAARLEDIYATVIQNKYAAV